MGHMGCFCFSQTQTVTAVGENVHFAEHIMLPLSRCIQITVTHIYHRVVSGVPNKCWRCILGHQFIAGV